MRVLGDLAVRFGRSYCQVSGKGSLENLQGRPTKRDSIQLRIIETQRLHIRTELTQPNHDFVISLGGIRGIGFILRHEHIHADVGVHPGLCQGGFIGGHLFFQASDFVRPFHVDLESVHVAELDGEIVVEEDVGEGVHGVTGCALDWVVPCRCETCGVARGFVTFAGELWMGVSRMMCTCCRGRYVRSGRDCQYSEDHPTDWD